MSEEEFDDPKLGSHSIDTQPVNTIKDDEDDDEFDAPFQIETEAVFKRLARDIYETDAAGIREPLTNAVTAILRAVEEGMIEEDEGVVEITVKDDGDGIRLSLRDNGIGMTMERINKIVAVIGASQSRDIGELAGQFGMGFLAVFRLVGINGGFEMHTNARYSDEGPISGMWKSGGFTKDEKELIDPKGLSEDDYGTKFNFILKDSISRDDIRSWVERFATWSRVPVVYEEQEGTEVVFEENYGGFDKKLESGYSDSKPTVVFENEYFRAVTSSESRQKTILLDVPCERSGGSIHTPLGDVDIRLKNENGVIISGPNEGKMLVSDGEYEGMEEQRQANFISESDTRKDDIIMPQPTGTRRVLEQRDKFWDFVEQKLNDKLNERIEEIMDSVKNFDDFIALKEEDFRVVCESLAGVVTRNYGGDFDPDKEYQKVVSWFQKNIGISISDELAKRISALLYDIRYAPEGEAHINQKHRLSTQNPAMAVYKAHHNDGDIFMGCRLSQEKAQIVWEDSEYNFVFRVPSTDQYEVYEELLEWRRLTEIKEENIDEFDISDSTKSDFLGVDEENVGNQQPRDQYELKIHFASSYTTNLLVSDLEEMLEENNGDTIEIGRRDVTDIILFPTHKDKQISNHYWASSKTTPMARCRKKDWDRLKEYDMVKLFNDYLSGSKQYEFTTARGEYTISEFENDMSDDTYLIFHILEEPYRSLFASEEYISDAEQIVNEQYTLDDWELVYAPVTPEKYNNMKPATVEHLVLRGDYNVGTLSRSLKDSNINRQKSVRNDVRMYMAIRLAEWSHTEQYQTLRSQLSTCTLEDGGYEIVETLAEGFESNGGIIDPILTQDN